VCDVVLLCVLFIVLAAQSWLKHATAGHSSKRKSHCAYVTYAYSCTCAADVLQVLNYDDFVSKPLSKKPAHMSTFNSSDHPDNVSVNASSICGDRLDCVAPIAILNTSHTGIGPQQCEILQVQTSRFTIQRNISTQQLYCLWLQTSMFKETT